MIKNNKAIRSIYNIYSLLSISGIIYLTILCILHEENFAAVVAAAPFIIAVVLFSGYETDSISRKTEQCTLHRPSVFVAVAVHAAAVLFSLWICVSYIISIGNLSETIGAVTVFVMLIASLTSIFSVCIAAFLAGKYMINKGAALLGACFSSSLVLSVLRTFFRALNIDSGIASRYGEIVNYIESAVLVMNGSGDITEQIKLSETWRARFDPLQHLIVVGIPLFVFVMLYFTLSMGNDSSIPKPGLPLFGVDTQSSQIVTPKAIVVNDGSDSEYKDDFTIETQRSIAALFEKNQIASPDTDEMKWNAFEPDESIVSSYSNRKVSASWYISPEGWSIPTNLVKCCLFKALYNVKFKKVFIVGPTDSGKTSLLCVLFFSDMLATPIGCPEYNYYLDEFSSALKNRTALPKTNTSLITSPPMLLNIGDERFESFSDHSGGSSISGITIAVRNTDLLLILIDLNKDQRVKSIRTALQALDNIQNRCANAVVAVSKIDQHPEIKETMMDKNISREDLSKAFEIMLAEIYGTEFTLLKRKLEEKAAHYSFTGFSSTGGKDATNSHSWEPFFVEELVKDLWR